MTANQLYRTTLAIMSENESNASSYTEFVIPNINVLLSELFDTENSLRAAEGQPILTEIPQVAQLIRIRIHTTIALLATRQVHSDLRSHHWLRTKTTTGSFTISPERIPIRYLQITQR